MTERITVTEHNGVWSASCRCGAPAELVEITDLCGRGPSYMPGALKAPCRCPRCFTCRELLDDEGRCDNLDCLNLGLVIPTPD